jgi:hypothetical protein
LSDNRRRSKTRQLAEFAAVFKTGFPLFRLCAAKVQQHFAILISHEMGTGHAPQVDWPILPSVDWAALLMC